MILVSRLYSRLTCLDLLYSFVLLLLQIDWILSDHHLLLNTRQNLNNLHLNLLFKPFAKYLEILDYYLESFLCYNSIVKPTLAPSPGPLADLPLWLGSSQALLKCTISPSCNTFTKFMSRCSLPWSSTSRWASFQAYPWNSTSNWVFFLQLVYPFTSLLSGLPFLGG